MTVSSVSCFHVNLASFFMQVSCHVCPSLEDHWFKHLKSSLAKLAVNEIHPIEMVHTFT